MGRVAELVAAHDTSGEMLAVIGHNNPPEPSPFDAHAVNIGDLFDEAKNFADGAGIENQGQADAVQTLMRRIQEAHTAADNSRKEENQPFDDGKAAVQAKYAPLIADTKAVKGMTVMAIDALKKVLAPWLVKQEEERKAKAAQLRKEAEDAAEAARLAATTALDSGDLAATEQAEAAFTDAKHAERAAVRVENNRSQATGYGRATLRDNWQPVMTDGVAALRHYWDTRRTDLEAFALSLARSDVQSGKRVIPGFEITNNQVVV